MPWKAKQEVLVSFFSRSYCYTLHSMIGYWHHPVVRLSVRLSVCLWRCALWLSGLVYRAKSCTSVLPAGIFHKKNEKTRAWVFHDHV